MSDEIERAVRIMREADERIITTHSPGWAAPYREAIAILGEVVGREPENDLALAWLADAKYSAGDRSPTGEAAAIAQGVLFRERDAKACAVACCVLAAVEASRREVGGERGPIIEWYRTGFNFDRANVRAGVMLADELANVYENEAALEVLDESLKHNPDEVELHEVGAYIIRHDSSLPVERGVHHCLRVEEIRGLRDSQCGDLAVFYTKLKDWRSMFHWLREAERREAEEVGREGGRRVVRGVSDPVMWKLAEAAASRLVSEPENFEHAAYLAMCLEFMQPVRASICADTIIEEIDAERPRTFELLAERAVQRINNDLIAEGAYGLVPMKNPWPPGGKKSKLGRRVIVVDAGGDGSNGNGDGH